MKPTRRRLPHKDEILASKWLRPLRPYLSDEHLWTATRSSVSRGVAIGLFVGFFMPVTRALFAIIAAVALRAHVPISAALTFIGNPFTVPPIYLAAYHLGALLLPKRYSPAWSPEPGESWLTTLMHLITTAWFPLVTGLAVIACSSAALGYLLVQLFWRGRED